MIEMSEMSEALKDKGLALVRVEVAGSDFKKSLKSKEIGLDKDIERELATLGRKSVLGNEYPRRLRNNKDQVYTYLDKMGVRFGTFGTWAVPVNIYKEVTDFLEEKKHERDCIKEMLLRHYDAELEAFAEKAESMRPGFGQVVRENAYDKDHIRAQIQMSIEMQDDIMGGVALSAVHGLSRMAKDYEQKIMKKAKDSNSSPVITRFTRSKLEEMRDYCYRFVFLTSVLNQASDVIQDAIDCLPATVVKGNRYPDETSKVMTVLKLLRTPDDLEGITIADSTADSTATQTPDSSAIDSASEDEGMGNESKVETNEQQLEAGDELVTVLDEPYLPQDEEYSQEEPPLTDDSPGDAFADDVFDDYWDDSSDDLFDDVPETQSRSSLLSLCE